MTFLQFALLGLGAGGAYAISGIGLTQIYRGSGVLNLAHGAIAFFCGSLFVWAYERWHIGFVPALIVAVVAGGLIGALIEALVMRRLARASQLVRIIATLGVFAILEQAVPLVFGTNFQEQNVSSFYPQGAFHFGSTVSLPYDRSIVVGVTVVLAILLRLLMNKTKFGLATTATAENPLVASTMGVDAGRTALTNWTLGAALAGLAGVLLVPILASLDPTPLLELVIPTLAAAMIGRFSSYGLTVVGGLGIGIGESLLIRYQATIFGSTLASGWPDALPFLVIIVMLIAGGTPFPRRGEITARLPRVGRARLHPLAGIVLAVAAAAIVFATSDYLASTVATMAGLAIVGLSLVVITGLAGQTSLAQLSVSGAAALIAGRLSHSQGWPFPVVVIAGVAAGALVGVLFALPALRTRGPTLAIATLGIGVAIEDVVLDNGKLTLSGLYGGTPIHSPVLFGIHLDGLAHPQRYAALTVLVLGLAGVAVANLRGSPTGRRLLAMRSSERAAAASGISLSGAKTAAFVVAAALASLGGVLMAFQNNTLTYAPFDLLSSLNLVIFTLIGGVGYVVGPMLGALMSPTGLMNYFFASHPAVQRWLIALGGLGLLLVLVSHPDGQGRLGELLGRWLREHGWLRVTDARPMASRPAAPLPRQAAALEVSGLTVRYGSVVALDDLNIRIEPGQIVGLIGPNGAGKTTAIDAISGFARPRAGGVRLGTVDLTGKSPDVRSRAGIARTFQTVEPFDDLTVGENLAVTVEDVRWWHWITDLFHRRRVALPESVRAEAAALGLDDLDAEPDALSQGQRRILGVMRAVASSPSVVLLDEPAAGLNHAETAHLGTILRRVATERHMGMLLVEHDLSIVTEICDWVVAIDFGRTIFDGLPAGAVSDPTVKSAYLGEASDPVDPGVGPVRA